jgi:uncharacterized protein HemY
MITISIIAFIVVVIALCILATLVSGLMGIIMIPFECISSFFRERKSHKNNTKRN